MNIDDAREASIDAALAAVLERLSDPQLHALAAACSHLDAPDGGLAQTVAGAPPASIEGVRALSSGWRASPGLTGPGVALALRAGLRARRDADTRRSRPVWTGPSSVGERRLTAAVLHELIATASKRILLVSYAAYTLPELAADLEAAVGRDCDVDIVFETATDSAGQYSGPHRPFGQIAGINRWRWPPEHRPAGAVLHAKLLVIDGHSALIGSANLTDRALHANLEAGLLVHDPEVAAELEGHIRRLMGDGVLIRERTP